ncbi:MAG: hypothetical protein GKR92_03875 [Gammaproteobacteria bacterium]|nr:MAG: hypothetical protein GKR92_03875 [Gammaproteobacteria bacterium]
MDFDRTLLTDNFLIAIITCIEEHGYNVDDFEFSTQRTQSYKQGILDPTAVVYASRISTGVEKSYVLEGQVKFSDAFCADLTTGFF